MGNLASLAKSQSAASCSSEFVSLSFEMLCPCTEIVVGYSSCDDTKPILFPQAFVQATVVARARAVVMQLTPSCRQQTNNLQYYLNNLNCFVLRHHIYHSTSFRSSALPGTIHTEIPEPRRDPFLTSTKTPTEHHTKKKN